jgi:hypothetical protein
MTPDPLDRFANRHSLFGPSPGDKILAHASEVRLSLTRFADEDGKPFVSCTYRVTGCMDVAPDVATGELLLGMIRDLKARRREDDGGAA